MKGKFYGIGVGPGDPELLTYKAVRILQEVDCVAAPVTGREKESTAFRIAGRFTRPEADLLTIDFPMTRDRARLEDSWQTARKAVQERLEEGQDTAFLTLGDPMLYSTYIYLYHHLEEAGYPVCTVPGITSFSAAAAASGVPLAFGDEKVALLPGKAAEELEAEELDGFETLVLFKVARCYGQIVELLEASGRLEGSVLVMSCGHPEERVITDLKAVSGDELSYFSLIISRKEPVLEWQNR